MNVYFEINPSVDLGGAFDNHRYYCVYNTRKSAVLGGGFRGMLLHSDRVWIEDKQGVRFLKHRTELPELADVDPKEFMWIKLKSIAVT